MFRPPRLTVSGHTAYDGLHRREFGPHRPYWGVYFLPEYPAAFDFPGGVAAGKQQPHTTSGNDSAGVVIGVVLMLTGLTDKHGSRNPVVMVDVPTLGTFPRGLIRVYFNAKLSRLDGLVISEGNRFPPGRGENPLVQSSLGRRPVLGPFPVFILPGLGFPRHAFDVQVFIYNKQMIGIPHDRSAGFVGEILSHVFFRIDESWQDGILSSDNWLRSAAFP